MNWLYFPSKTFQITLCFVPLYNSFLTRHCYILLDLLQVIGVYVGVATVGVFVIWYTHSSFLGIDLSADGHSLVTYNQLANWHKCSSWEGFSASNFTAGSQVLTFDTEPCDYFLNGKIKASTLSLSVLVAIEMFNSLNALSEDSSLLTTPPWVNPWLLRLALSDPLRALPCSSVRCRPPQLE